MSSRGKTAPTVMPGTRSCGPGTSLAQAMVAWTRPSRRYRSALGVKAPLPPMAESGPWCRSPSETISTMSRTACGYRVRKASAKRPVCSMAMGLGRVPSRRLVRVVALVIRVGSCSVDGGEVGNRGLQDRQGRRGVGVDGVAVGVHPRSGSSRVVGCPAPPVHADGLAAGLVTGELLTRADPGAQLLRIGVENEMDEAGRGAQGCKHLGGVGGIEYGHGHDDVAARLGSDLADIGRGQVPPGWVVLVVTELTGVLTEGAAQQVADVLRVGDHRTGQLLVKASRQGALPAMKAPLTQMITARPTPLVSCSVQRRGRRPRHGRAS